MVNSFLIPEVKKTIAKRLLVTSLDYTMTTGSSTYKKEGATVKYAKNQKFGESVSSQFG